MRQMRCVLGCLGIIGLVSGCFDTLTAESNTQRVGSSGASNAGGAGAAGATSQGGDGLSTPSHAGGGGTSNAGGAGAAGATSLGGGGLPVSNPPHAGEGGTSNAGGAGAAGATSQGTGGLQVSFAAAYPGGVLLGNRLGLLMACDRENNLIAIGPRSANDLSKSDPGPRILRLSPSGEQLAAVDYPSAVTPEVMTIDSKGATIVAGQLYRDVNFGGSLLQPVEDGHYLVKLDAAGKEVWARRVETPDTFWLRDLVVDASDDIYVSGSQTDMTAGWTERANITKYSGVDGKPIWKQLYPNSNSTAAPNGLALYSAGTVAVAGAFNGTLQIGSETLVTTATSAGYESYNGWFARLNSSDGSPSGVQRFGGAIFDYATAVAVTGGDRLRLAGQLSGTSGIAGVVTSANAKGSPFVAEVDSNGKGQWISLLGNRGSVTDMAIDPSNRSIAVGRLAPEQDRTDGKLDDTLSFVAVIDETGAVSQQVTFTTRSNGANEVVADGLGGVWVSGEFTGAVKFGRFALQAADYQIFLVKLSP